MVTTVSDDTHVVVHNGFHMVEIVGLSPDMMRIAWTFQLGHAKHPADPDRDKGVKDQYSITDELFYGMPGLLEEGRVNHARQWLIHYRVADDLIDAACRELEAMNERLKQRGDLIAEEVHPP